MKFWGGLIVGIIVAVGLACLVTYVASAVNGVTFAEQIIEWATTNTPAVEDVVINGALDTPIV